MPGPALHGPGAGGPEQLTRPGRGIRGQPIGVEHDTYARRPGTQGAVGEPHRPVRHRQTTSLPAPRCWTQAVPPPLHCPTRPTPHSANRPGFPRVASPLGSAPDRGRSARNDREGHEPEAQHELSRDEGAYTVRLTRSAPRGWTCISEVRHHRGGHPEARVGASRHLAHPRQAPQLVVLRRLSKSSRRWEAGGQWPHHRQALCFERSSSMLGGMGDA